MRTIVLCNDAGRRIGETHHLAKLTDHEVGMLLDLRDQGLSYATLAAKFEISKSQARNIIKGYQRSQTATRQRVVFY